MAKAARFFGLVPAGGAGRRFGGTQPKQYAMLGGRTVLEHSVNALLADKRVEHVFVLVADGDTQAITLFSACERVSCLAFAGEERVNTVLNGLQAMLQSGKAALQDWVLVHDAARPGLAASALAELIDAASAHPVGGLLALPVVDTLKKASQPESGGGGVKSPPHAEGTVPRTGLWAAQTPQMFRIGNLRDAIEHCLKIGLGLTDDASAIEATGGAPLLVRGHFENMKITMPGDLDIVARLTGLER